MDFITIGIKVVVAAKQRLDKAEIDARLGDLERAASQLDQRISDGILAQVNAGFSHLKAALTVEDTTLSRDELGFARQCFNQLAERSSDRGVITGSTQQLFADEVIAYGHLGNYYYYALRDQPERALIEAYRCTERFPAIGLRMFPSALFSTNYLGHVPSYEMTRNPLELKYVKSLAAAKVTRRRHGLEMAWRIPAAAGLFIAGLAGSMVSPTLAISGTQAAAGLLSTSDQGLARPALPDHARVLALSNEAEAQLAPVIAEARQRRLAVQRHLDQKVVPNSHHPMSR